LLFWCAVCLVQAGRTFWQRRWQSYFYFVEAIERNNSVETSAANSALAAERANKPPFI
jgi:hypothetical protein